MAEVIGISSAVNLKTGASGVILTWGQEKAVLSVEEARQHALSILEAAEAAETDAFLRRFLESKGASDDAVESMLKDMRGARAALREREVKE